MKKIMTGVVLAAMLAGNAGASILFTDDFSGAGSGTGWSDSWSAGTISGGNIDVNNTTSYRTLTTTIDTDAMDFWYVANVKVTGTSTGWAGLSFFAGTDEDFFAGSNGSGTKWGYRTDLLSDLNGGNNTGIDNFTGVDTLVVTHITASSISMWIDPIDTSSETAMGSADATTLGNVSDKDWTRVRIGTSRNVAVYDMTAATTFTEAIPEPATLSMIALFGGGILFIRRKLAM